MTNAPSLVKEQRDIVSRPWRFPRSGLAAAFAAVLISVLTPLILPKGYALAACGDLLQFALLAATALLAFRNFLFSHSRVRIFWFLTFLGMAIWAVAAWMWAFNEVFLRHPVPTAPFVDILLFVLIVPLTTAFAAAPHRQGRSPFRAFGFLDVSVLMVYALYLYGIAVFSYLLLPGAISTYNFRFDVADTVGNFLLVIAAALSLLTSQGPWKAFYRLYFLAACGCAFSSSFLNAIIDSGHYSSGGFYDIPFVLSLTGLFCTMLVGRSLTEQQPAPDAAPEAEELPGRAAFLSSHLAMLVVLSTPVVGIWLLSSPTSAPLLRFRLITTLLTMLLLALLLFIKEDLLTAGQISSLARLSETYTNIDSFKSRLSESEKMAALGELVAHIANQIKRCMTVILDSAARLSSRPDTDSRVQSMAGKIAQYAQRTDALVDNMLHFAQESPMRPAPLDIKPLLESALQLSRISKLPDVHVTVTQEGECPLVRGDSSQLLHVFLQLTSNAVDALQEVKGGSLEIKIYRAASQLVIEFNDSGPGMKEPARVFEPFYTTKPVGQGTGLGLSTCYGIMQQHRGEITCRNRLTGGASFTVRLPLATPEPSANISPGSVLLEGAS